jgi:hypothetical protein
VERNCSEASGCGIELHSNSMLMKAAIRLEFTREKIGLGNAVQARNALGCQIAESLSETHSISANVEFP